MFKSLFTTIAILIALMSTAFAQTTTLPRTISISGHGEVRGTPDVASITMGVTSQAETAGAALAANTKAMQVLLATLKAAGIADKDMATSNFSVNPRYDYGKAGDQPPKVVGYDVNNSVTIVVRKLDMLGALLDQAVTAGSNQIQGISFSISKPDPMLDEARKLAVADARRKAELYAAAIGAGLGDVVSIGEGANYQPPMPMVTFNRAEKAAGDAVPIAQGEQALAIDVSMTWVLK
jgi:uncharacterized protein